MVRVSSFMLICFFFQAEDGIRAGHVTGVQTCALPISRELLHRRRRERNLGRLVGGDGGARARAARGIRRPRDIRPRRSSEIGRASCRERAQLPVVIVSLNKKKESLKGAACELYRSYCS